MSGWERMRKQESIQDFDQFAQSYASALDKHISLSGEESDFFVKIKVRLMRDFMKGRTQHKISILDFGCGTGRAAPHVRHYFPHSAFFGLDPSKESIAVAKKNKQGGKFAVLTSHTVLKKNMFDVIFSAVVFHHIPPRDRLKALQGIRARLKKGGYFFLFEHNPYNPLVRVVVRACPFDKGVHLLKPTYAKGLLKRAGFDVCNSGYYFFFPKALFWLRPCERFLRYIPLGAQYFIVGVKND